MKKSVLNSDKATAVNRTEKSTVTDSTGNSITRTTAAITTHSSTNLNSIETIKNNNKAEEKINNFSNIVQICNLNAIDTFQYTSQLNTDEEKNLQNVANFILQQNKGVLIIDETSEEFENYVKLINLENTAEIRRRYRQLLLTLSNLSLYISGVILNSETFEQKTEKNESFANLLHRQNIAIGIRLDLDIVPLNGGPIKEYITEGLDGLAKRAQYYKQNGCMFAKWKTVYSIGKHSPSHLALIENANHLARFASICQKEGLLPIIEYSIENSNAYDSLQCQMTVEKILSYIYKALTLHNVYLEGTLLRTNVISSEQNKNSTIPLDIAQTTLTAFQRTVPVAVPGILLQANKFSAVHATMVLNMFNQTLNQKLWSLTYGFDKEIDVQILQIWSGYGENVRAAQLMFEHRLKANCEALLGKYVNERSVAALLTSTTKKQIKPYY